MRTTRTGIITFLLIITILLLSACGKSGYEGGPSSLVKEYSTLGELTSDAEDIAEINVLSQETITYLDVPFTISTVTVKSALKGSIKEGDTIKVIETGGEYSPIGKDGKELPKTNLKFNGIEVLSKNDHAILFLNKFVGPQVKDAYVPVGVYQGKFKVISGEAVQQAPEKEKLKDYKPIVIDSFKEKINQEKKSIK
ncbi:hypothetical protein [Paenibacillus ferrarius]|uniref:hypothetical protein n=1 Tax=Paenibacillus ferrarius TaxID=1469647 RepID=UPI003D2A2FA8